MDAEDKEVTEGFEGIVGKDATNRMVGMLILKMSAEERSKRGAEMTSKATREEPLSKFFIGTYCSL